MESRLATTVGRMKIETVGPGLKEWSQFEIKVAHSGRCLNFAPRVLQPAFFGHYSISNINL